MGCSDNIYRAIAAILMTVSFGLAANEESTENVLTDSQRELVRSYIDAVNSKDINKLKSLYYPPSFTCIEKNTEHVVTSSLLSSFGNKIIDFNEPFSTVSLYSERVKPMIDGLMFSTIQPTHSIEMSFKIFNENAKYKYGGSIVWRSIIEKDNRWYFILYCPTETYLQSMSQQK